MTRLDFLNKKQEKEILRNIKTDIPKEAKLVKFGKRIYSYTGDLNSNQIINLSRVARIKNVGTLLFEMEK
jgi:hypothetical protein